MMQHSSRDPEGTLSYVTGTGSLYLKVSQGWKEVQVLSDQQTRFVGAKLQAPHANVCCCRAAGESDPRLQQHHPTRRGHCC